MKTWAKILGASALLVVGAALAAEIVHKAVPCGTWRYKVTVNVDTPEGLKTGHAVREAKVCLVKHLVPEVADADVNPKGEAVVVDLGKRGVLFALTNFDNYQILWSVFPGPPAFEEKGLRYYETLKAKAVLKPDQYPQMVMFKDITDPKSVTMAKGWVFDVKTQQHVPVDHLAELFGAGVTIKDVTVEMTEEPVTWGIEKRLGWLSANKGGYLDGQFAGGGPELSNILHGGNFKHGDEK